MRCLEEDADCRGGVELRFPLSGSGRSFPRCEAHWEARLACQAGIEARYPPLAPSGFDPGFAGERWEEDH